MSLALLCEPEFSAADRSWIEGIRERHDPQHGRVPPHVTLVFPVTNVEAEPLARHVETIAAQTGRIEFCLRSALAVKDALSEMAHVFLVPDEGFAALVRLHDRLYAGPLAGALRLDIPFIPHVTVAGFTDVVRAMALADNLNEAVIAVAGSISAITMIRLDGGMARTVDRIRLKDG